MSTHKNRRNDGIIKLTILPPRNIEGFRQYSPTGEQNTQVVSKYHPTGYSLMTKRKFHLYNGGFW